MLVHESVCLVRLHAGHLCMPGRHEQAHADVFVFIHRMHCCPLAASRRNQICKAHVKGVWWLHDCCSSTFVRVAPVIVSNQSVVGHVPSSPHKRFHLPILYCSFGSKHHQMRAMGEQMGTITVIAACTSVLAVLWLAYSVLRRRGPFLESKHFKPAHLIEKESVTHNSSRYRFSIGDGKVLGLPVGQHISFKFEDSNGKEVMRPYTPTSGNSCVGHVDFVIKTYPRGRMSQHVDHLRIGDSILMRGPKGKFQYHRGMKRAFGALHRLVHTMQPNTDALAACAACSAAQLGLPHSRQQLVQHAACLSCMCSQSVALQRSCRVKRAQGYARAGMVAGGTGVTPMFQVMRQIAADPLDTTDVHLLFGNVSAEDILLRDELDKLATQHAGQISVTYVLDEAPPGWPGEVGYVTAAMLQRHCPAPADNVMLLLCGPRPMTKAVEGAAAEVGYSKDAVFTF